MNELLIARIGFDLSSGTGWTVPVIKRADWPLGRLVVTEKGITIQTTFLRDTVLAWTEMTSVQATWTGLTICYEVAEIPHELSIVAPSLARRLRIAASKHSLPIPGW
ncbi:MAG: hypothetical protein JWP89_446 [Schlesneria sp.]|nr:hypothetical protein [Schlesneria sp.]